jgi:hypothetical protein
MTQPSSSLLELCIRIEDVRNRLDDLHLHGMGGISADVSEPLYAGIVQIDHALRCLKGHIGEATFKEHRHANAS